MKLLTKIQKDSSAQALFTFVYLVLIFLLAIYFLFEQNRPRLTHTLDSFDKEFELVWYQEKGYGSVVSNGNGVVFALPLGEEKLFAFDSKTGLMYWEIELSFHEGGKRVFLADSSSVYIVNAVQVSAYDAKTGSVRWSTEIGDGHVAIEAYLLHDKMELYYGERLYELDLITGKILSEKHGVANESYPQFKIVNDKILLTNSTSEGMCAQQLNPRKVLWCKPEFELIDMAVDENCELGYAMPNEDTLWVVDLFTGHVLGKTSFSRNIPVDEEDGYTPALFFADGVVIVSFIDSGQSYGLTAGKICPRISSLQ